MRSIQDLSARLNRLTDVRAIARGDRGRGQHAGRLPRHPRLRRRLGAPDVRPDRVHARDARGRSGGCRGAAARRDRRGLHRLGRRARRAAAHQRRARRRARQDDRRDRGRPGVDARGADAVRGPRARRHRAQPARLQPIQHRRPPDDEHLRRLRGAGDGERDELRPAAWRSRPSSRAAPTRSAACWRSTSGCSSTLDQADVLETIADGLREVVAYDNLSIYRADHAAAASCCRSSPASSTRSEVSRYLIPFGQGLMGWAVEHAQPILANDALSDPRAAPDPRHAGGPGGGGRGPAHRRRRGARRPQRLARRRRRRSTSARATSS